MSESNANDGDIARNVIVKKSLSALFYGTSSCLIMIINKSILTTYLFPSFQALALGQLLTTILVLSSGKYLGLVQFPDLSIETFHKIWPLPLFHLGNMMFGLGGTKSLSLPMLTVLRRFTILFTMVGEYFILANKPSMLVQLSVYLMISGALVAASNDLAFNIRGYVYVLLNDFFTAGNGIVIKQKLESKELGKFGLMFYNSLFMFLPALAVFMITEDVSIILEFQGWFDPMFVVQFLLSCVFGFILMFSTILCTGYNSALTTTIVGCLKNIIITYTGMFIGGDYQYSLTNFVGLNISIFGSLIYTKVILTSKPVAPPQPLPK